MPAPDHLLPILDKLGDGATVALAETVHQMLADAAAGGAVPQVAEAFEEGKTYIIRAKDYGAADDLGPELAALHERTGAEFVVFDVDVDIDRATLAAADLTVLAEAKTHLKKLATVLIEEFDGGGDTAEDDPHGHETTCEHAIRLLREQAADAAKLRDVVGQCARAIAFSYGGVSITPDTDPEDRAMIEAMRAAYAAIPEVTAAPPAADTDPAAAHDEIQPGPAQDAAEAERIARTGTNTTGSEVAVDIDWGDDGEDPTTEPLAGPAGERPATEAAGGPSNADVRAWCQANGVPVNAKGAIRADARAAYDAAHQEA